MTVADVDRRLDLAQRRHRHVGHLPAPPARRRERSLHQVVAHEGPGDVRGPHDDGVLQVVEGGVAFERVVDLVGQAELHQVVVLRLAQADDHPANIFAMMPEIS